MPSLLSYSLMSVLDAGGEELETSDEVFEIYTEPQDFTDVRDALTAINTYTKNTRIIERLDDNRSTKGPAASVPIR